VAETWPVPSLWGRSTVGSRLCPSLFRALRSPVLDKALPVSSVYLQGFRHEFRLILISLLSRVVTGKWHQALSRQLQQTWWRALHRAASYGRTLDLGELSALVVSLSFWSVFRDILLL